MYTNILLKEIMDITMSLLQGKNSRFKVATAELANIFVNFLHFKMKPLQCYERPYLETLATVRGYVNSVIKKAYTK